MSLTTKSRKVVKIGDATGEVRSERYNPLIGRLEVEVEINHMLKPTPSRIEIRKSMSNAYGVSVDRVYVISVKTEYGAGISNAVVHIYDNVDRALKFEPEYIIKRNGGVNLEG